MKNLDQASYFGNHYGQTVLDINYLIDIASKNNFVFLGLAEGVVCDRQDILIFRKN